MLGPDSEKESVTILLVEDDDVAAEVVMRSARQFPFACEVVWARDGLQAIQILRGIDPTTSIDTSHDCQPIVLLDLNMPRMDGFEFLEQLRADCTLQQTIVFVLTTSSAEADVRLSYFHNVAGYLVKSQLGRGMEKLGNLLRAYTAVVHLPQSR